MKISFQKGENLPESDSDSDLDLICAIELPVDKIAKLKSNRVEVQNCKIEILESYLSLAEHIAMFSKPNAVSNLPFEWQEANVQAFLPMSHHDKSEWYDGPIIILQNKQLVSFVSAAGPARLIVEPQELSNVSNTKNFENESLITSPAIFTLQFYQSIVMEKCLKLNLDLNRSFVIRKFTDISDALTIAMLARNCFPGSIKISLPNVTKPPLPWKHLFENIGATLNYSQKNIAGAQEITDLRQEVPKFYLDWVLSALNGKQPIIPAEILNRCHPT